MEYKFLFTIGVQIEREGLGYGYDEQHCFKQYSISVQKKAMETQELALQELQEMLPPSPYGFDVRA